MTFMELSEYVRSVLKDRKLAEKLAGNSYERVKAYEWKERCRRILERFCG